ncbi:hypothetical protein Bbelb_418670 [Branchiostoma belcheri]|nr:hypothetical protein Bbelb_418670 [Branchiostoma belcheri]
MDLPEEPVATASVIEDERLRTGRGFRLLSEHHEDDEVIDMCQGRSSCSFAVTDSNFGAPCDSGTSGPSVFKVHFGCYVPQCPTLTLSNGAVSGSRGNGDTLTFTCNTGYNLVGSSTLTCQSDLTWSGSPPTCEALLCPTLTTPVNGAVSGSNVYGDTLTFTCYTGYNLVGSSTLTCQSDLTWSGSPPTCSIVQCPTLQSPTNGGSSGDNYYQDVMSFTCDSGYDLEGSASITCQADGTWNDSAPSCPPVQCPLLAAPDYGEMTGDNYYQSVVTFLCDPGYELVGLPSLICQADRTWSGIGPNCSRVQCPALSSPVNGNSSGPNFYQDVVQFTCDQGYDLVGDSSSTCQADRTWSSNVPSCNDIDECSAANGGCDHVCTNTMGSFQCSCAAGFTLNVDRLSCDDMYECAVGNVGCHQNCNNIIGSYWCSCGSGYRLNGNGHACDDVDECFAASGGCAQTCTNTVGSFYCSCGPGFSLNANGLFCDDLDECASTNGGCEQTCTNDIGSFQCSCGAGYNLDGNGFTCDDVNECASANGGCEQTCRNNIGSFQCSCSNGYRPNSNNLTCDDMNECDTANGGCDQNCTNLIGSYQCSCGIGSNLNADRHSCNDINECHTANGGCQQMCNNTIGSFQCGCSVGYALNAGGFTCDDVDECDIANGGCGQICNNSIGSFECFCRTGYILHVDGLVCNDIDECNTANGGCGQFCKNTVGSFSCYCSAGYSLGVDRLACDGFDPVSHLSCSTITTTSVSITWIEPVSDIMGYGIIYKPTQGLPPPTDVTLSLDTPESATVRWSQPGRSVVFGYRSWLTDKETMSIISSRFLPQSATSVTFTPLVPATEYVVSVSCVNAFFEGPQAAVSFVTETDPLLRLFVDSIRYSSLALFWTPPVAKLTGYELTFGSTEGHRNRRSTVSVTIPGESDNYLIQDLVPATQYVFSLTAVSRFGRSGTDPPSDLKVHKVSSSWMYVKWTPPVAAVVSYHLEVIKVTSLDEMRFSATAEVTELQPTHSTRRDKYSSANLRRLNTHHNSTFTVSKLTHSSNIHSSMSPSLIAYNITKLLPTTKYIIRIAAVSMYGRSVNIETFSSTEVNDLLADAPSQRISAECRRGPARGGAFIKYSTTESPTSAAIATDIHTPTTEFKTTEALQLNQLYSFTNTDYTRDVKTFALEELETTSMSTTTDKEPSENTISIVTDIHDLFQLDTFPVSSTEFLMELAMDRAVNSLLAILPYLENYETAFEEDNAMVAITRSTTNVHSNNNNVILRYGQVNVSAYVTNCSFDGSIDAAMVVMERNLFSWNSSTFGQNVTTPIVIFSLGDQHTDNCDMQLDLRIPIKLELTEKPRRRRRALLEDEFVGRQFIDNGADSRRITNLTMAYYAFDVPDAAAVVVMQLSWWDHAAAYRVFFRYDSPPTEERYDDMKMVMVENIVLAWHRETDSLRTWLPDINRRRGKLPKAVIGGSVHFPPNSIDFDSVFGNPESLTSNIVFYSVIGEWAVYLLLMIILHVDFQRLREKIGYGSTAANRKERLAQLSILPPDRMPAPYLYQITVNTGSMFGAGTSARIGLQVFGSMGKTAVKFLNPRGEVRSGFSKSERLSCCFAIVNSMMVVSAMWFRDANDYYTKNNVYNLGFIQFTLQELYVSLVTTVMVIPVTLLPLLLFRKEIPVRVTVPGIRRSCHSGKRLSHWTKYVAWLIVVSVSIVSSFFVIMYGLDWGKEKSESWLKAFCLSFCLSSVVAETGQIFILALIAALISPAKVYPPKATSMQRMKRKTEQRQKFFLLLKNASVLFLSVVVLFFISQQDKDPFVFHASQTLSNRLTDDFDLITTPDDFWTWAEGVMLPVLYPSLWYNGWKMKYLDRQFPLYTEAFRIGPPRLTQIRVAPDCRSECSMEFPTTLDETTSTMAPLQQNHWIDKYTKRLDLELSFYYPSRKLFSILKMTVNQEDIGHLSTSTVVGTQRLFQYENTSDYGMLAAHILFILLFLVHIINDAIAMKKEGIRYFGSIWNLIATLSLLGSAATICTFGIRYHFASAALEKIVEATGELGIDTFVDLGPSFWWDDAFKYVLASVVFVNTLALLRMVKFNKTIAHFLALPGAMKNDLMEFSLVSAIAFMAFSSSGMVVFGTHKKAFTNFIHTNFALFEMVLGSFDTEEILEANRYVGPVYFTFFMICIFIILVNFLVTIICDAIASRASIDDDYDQDLVDYIWTSFKEMLGIHSAPINDVTAGEVKLAELKANLHNIEDCLGDILDVTECLWPRITSDVTSSHHQPVTPRHHSTTMSSDTCQMIHEEATSSTTPAVSDVQEQARCLLKAHEDDTARLEEVRNEGRRRAEAILKTKLAERRRKSELDQTAMDTAQELMEQHTADVARMEERQKGARRMFENKLRQKLAARRVQKKDNAI